MGVFIYPCKIKEKVSGLTKTNEEMDALYEKYDAIKEELVVLENTSKYDDFISPFEEGIYTYEGGKADVTISYGTYSDFLQRLENMRDEDGIKHYAYDTTISASGIDNCISYKVAEEMLEEFKEYQEQAYNFFHKEDDDYDTFLWNIYKSYMEVLQECIELKGIVRYH